MKRTLSLLVRLMPILALAPWTGCGQDQPYDTRLSAKGALEIVRRPPPANFERGPLASLPSYDSKRAQNPWQIDLRGYDLRDLQISNRVEDLLHASFDAKTQWPATLPVGFEPERILALGKDPGLGIRQLHAKGITGKGVSIAIIDQPLLTDHTEYRDRLRLYEEIHQPAVPAQMHGPAVASIAVGKTVGVAPDSDLYYIAETHGVFGGKGKFDWDFTWLAQSIDRLLEVNASLPKEKKIRVLSISVGWSSNQKGYAEVTAAVERARKEGVFVISTAIEETHALAFHGLGRGVLADPNAVGSFGPGSWWAARYWNGQGRFAPGKRLLVPMDARGVASPTGLEDYVFYAEGGWSWSVPWLAGLYALACQVKPDVTPELFWAAALETGHTIRLQKDQSEAEFGTIANPAKLIEVLGRG